LVRAASGCGINALFMEVHDNPSKAKSDPNTVLDIVYLEKILIMAKTIHQNRIKLDKKYGSLNVK
jgi:2-dehydro-3-deoxyphosphooctonate aldolase (KDO 8-P synthase)